MSSRLCTFSSNVLVCICSQSAVDPNYCPTTLPSITGATSCTCAGVNTTLGATAFYCCSFGYSGSINATCSTLNATIGRWSTSGTCSGIRYYTFCYNLLKVHIHTSSCSIHQHCECNVLQQHPTIARELLFQRWRTPKPACQATQRSEVRFSTRATPGSTGARARRQERPAWPTLTASAGGR